MSQSEVLYGVAGGVATVTLNRPKVNNAYNGDSFLGTYTITVVPEPSTYALSALATAGLASLMRWRKRWKTDSDA